MPRAKYTAVRMMVPLNLRNRRLTRPAWKTKVLKNMRKMMMMLKRIAISWMLQKHRTVQPNGGLCEDLRACPKSSGTP